MRAHVLSALAIIGLTGCIPTWPIETSAVIGTLRQNGVPVHGAEIYVLNWSGSTVTDHQCSTSPISAKTDENGEFRTNSTRALEWAPALGDRMFPWTLCIRWNGAWIRGYDSRGFGHGPKQLRLDCELAQAVPDNGRPAEEAACRHRAA
jgi:hypothetical protein